MTKHGWARQFAVPTRVLLYRRMVLGRILRVEGRQLRRNGPVLLRRDVPRPLVNVHRHPVLEGKETSSRR